MYPLGANYLILLQLNKSNYCLSSEMDQGIVPPDSPLLR